MKTVFVMLLAILQISFCNSKLLKLDGADKVIELTGTAGYKTEAHRVETKDGYLLKVYRLLPKFKTAKKPVFLMHGVLSSAVDFLITGPKIALAYLLADHGYEVWLGNSRGSLHSMMHRNYSIDSEEFWQFSWHEIGLYDFPAIIDYMLKKTRSSKALFVGHSQATSSLLVMLSMLPKYNKRIAQAHLLAPTAFVSNSPHNFFRTLYGRMGRGMLTSKYINMAPFLNLGRFFSRFTCRGMQEPMVGSCGGIIMLFNFVFGTNMKDLEVDTRIFEKLSDHISTRVGMMQFTHFFQLLFSGGFRRFDYESKNLEHYNSETPPEYQLQKVTAPVYLYHSAEDGLISRANVEHLADVLPNTAHYRVIDNWSHIDCTYGRNARKILYKDILKYFEAF